MDKDALTRAINDISHNLTVAAQGMAHFVNALTVVEENQILHLLAAVQARIPHLAAMVNENAIIAQNTQNAVMETMNGHISTLLTVTTNALAALSSV